MPALERQPEVPATLRHLWDCFADLCDSRKENHPIQNSEIEAWLNIHLVTDLWTRLDYFKAVRRLDRAIRKRTPNGSNSDRD